MKPRHVAFLVSALLVGAALAWLWTGGGGPRVDSRPSASGVPVPKPAPSRSAARRDPASSAPAVSRVPPIATAPAPAPGARLAMPVPGVAPSQLSDMFHDPRSEARSHQALDIMAPAGTPVHAVADGHVEKLFDSERGGLTVYQFEPTGTLAYYYAHLQGYAPGLAEGQAIRRGDLLGYVGSTGNADPAAPHLHFAVFLLGPDRKWSEGTPINPYPLLGGR